MTPADKLLDARDLEPPEPLEHTLAALDELQPEQRLRLLLLREPYPLYGILDNHGFHHETALLPDGYYEILIWR
ncbi:MAG: DUF2249 domain-containing protein [Burkholderiales bacterium]